MKLTPEMIRERLLSRQFKNDQEPPPENKILTIGNETIGCLNSLVTLSGLPKSGKSLFISALIASRITSIETFGFLLQYPENRPKIAYFDTESSQYDFYRQVNRIKQFCYREQLPDYLSLFCTREDTPGWNRLLIEQYIKENPECSTIIIDGLLDLIINYNDETESRKLIQWIKKLTAKYNILIITVLHTSKSGEQRLGHLGAGVDRYSQSVLEVIKENGNFLLKPKFLRSSGGFPDVQISYDLESGQYIQIFQGEPPPNDLNEYVELLTYNKRYTPIELIAIIKQHKKRGDNFAKSVIRELKEKKLIEKDIKGNYFLLVNF